MVWPYLWTINSIKLKAFYVWMMLLRMRVVVLRDIQLYRYHRVLLWRVWVKLNIDSASRSNLGYAIVVVFYVIIEDSRWMGLQSGWGLCNSLQAKLTVVLYELRMTWVQDQQQFWIYYVPWLKELRYAS